MLKLHIIFSCILLHPIEHAYYTYNYVKATDADDVSNNTLDNDGINSNDVDKKQRHTMFV